MSFIDAFEKLQTAPDTRRQILNAAMICLITLGPGRTNISTIAAQGGVSRPTVYAHFESLDDLLQGAIHAGVNLLVKALSAHADQFNTPEERLVEAYIWLLGLSERIEVLRQPMSFDLGQSQRDVIPEMAISVARKGLSRVMGEDLTDDLYADERAETAVRFFLSLAAYRKTEDLRGYLQRVVIPALGMRLEK